MSSGLKCDLFSAEEYKPNTPDCSAGLKIVPTSVNQCPKLLNENKPKTLGLFRKVGYFWFIFAINQISFKSFQHRGYIFEPVLFPSPRHC